MRALLAVTALLAALHVEPVKPHFAPLPDFEPRLLVDKDFTDAEFEQIKDAAHAWFVFTGGRYRLRVERGLSLLVPERPTVHWFVQVSQREEPVKWIDDAHPDGRILAFTTIPKDPYAMRCVFIIKERVRAERFKWVAMHEIGHLLGLDDIHSHGSIMSWQASREPVWFSGEDRYECIKAGVCFQ